MNIQMGAGVMRKAIKLLLWLTVLLGGLTHAGTVTYVYTDPQGTPLAEADASGTITATFDYAPYGSQALGTPPDGPGYTGHVNDPDTGLVYMQARYYDPSVGRFLSTDPVVPAASNPFNFNRYAYANNNPIVNIDPDGRQEAAMVDNAPSFWESVKNKVTNLAHQIGGDGKTLSGGNLNATAGNYAGALVRTAVTFSPLMLESSAARAAAIGTEGSEAPLATTLYRAVGPEELQDIQTTGAFRNLGPGSEGKYFTSNAASASSFAQQAVRGFGDAPYTMVSTEVQNSVLQTPGIQSTVDRGIQSFTIPNGNLPGLVPTIHNYSPIPPLLK